MNELSMAPCPPDCRWESQGKPSRREIIALLAILLVGLALRCWVQSAFSDLAPMGDQDDYLEDATQLVEGKPMLAKRGPGYPAYIAIYLKTLGMKISAVRIANLPCAALFILSMWALGRLLFGVGAGLSAAAWIALYPRSIFFSLYAYSENVYVVCLTAGLALCCLGLRVRNFWCFAGAGLLFGYGMLTREMLIYFVPVAGIMVFLLSRQKLGERLLMAVTVVTLAFAVVTPWTIRNYKMYDRFIPVGYSEGIPLLEGNCPEDADQRKKQIREHVQKKCKPGIETRIAENEMAKEQALQAILDRQPFWIFEKVAVNGPLLFMPNGRRDVIRGYRRDEPVTPLAVNLLRFLFHPLHLLTLVLGAAGFAWWRWRGLESLVLIYLFYALAIHLAANAGAFRFQYAYEWALVLAAAVITVRGMPGTLGRRILAAGLIALILCSQIPQRKMWMAPYLAKVESAAKEEAPGK